MSNHYSSHHNLEAALQRQTPEVLTQHRQAIIANAVRNLSIHAPQEIYEQVPVPQSEEVAAYQASQEVIAEANRITREAAQFKQETSVDRIMQNVDAIYEGQGNPLYDKETI